MVRFCISAVVVIRLSAVLISCLVAPMMAADAPLAMWAFGTGTLDGVAPAPEAVVHPGQVVESGAQPVRLELIGFAGSDVILASGSVARFSLEASAGQAAPTLVVQLERGALAVDVAGSGPYAALIARGGALESRATGAEFVLERGDHIDYVALAKGLLLVRLRAGLSTADGMAIQLQARQGLAGSDKGLSEVDQLNRRPQLDQTLPIQAQATEAGSDGDWSRDEAARISQDPPEDGTLTRAPVREPAPIETAVADKQPKQPVPEEVPVPVIVTEAEPVICPLPLPTAPVAIATRAEPITAADLRTAASARGAAVFLR